MRNPRILLLSAIAIGVLSHPVAAGAFGPETEGLKIALEVKPDSWESGSPVEFVCTVKNVSEKPIRVAAWGLDLAQALEITDAAGNVLKHDGGRNASRMRRDADFVVIAPDAAKAFTLTGRITPLKTRIGGKQLIVNELLGGIWHWSLVDGDYTVRAVLDRRADDAWMRRQAGGAYWTGRALSAPVTVTVSAKASTGGGEPVNGLKLTLAAEKTELGRLPDGKVEPTKITLTFTNVSDAPLKLNVYDWFFRLVTLQVTGPDADSVRAVKQMFFKRALPRPAEKDFPTIAPGGTWTSEPVQFPGLFGGTHYTLMKPGEYRVTVTWAVGAATRQVSPLAADCWLGTVISNKITFKTVPARE